MIDLNQQPYYDDYNKEGVGSNPHLRILFRPGYPVQARELTQIQSILQGQIERFGSHVFKDGSKVLGGDLSINKVKYLVLDAASLAPTTPISMAFLKGKELQNATGTVRAKIIDLSKPIGSTAEDARTLIISYTTSGEFGPSEHLEIVDHASWVQTEASNYTGDVTVANINEGVFFTKGFFVHVEPQSIVVDRSWTSTHRVGLNVSDLILTESEDPSLLDPAFGSYNYNAPGAHRYQVQLELSTRLLTDINEVDTNFIELLRLGQGEIVSEIKNPKYSVFEDELARRTYDESGSYTVRPFPISIEAHETDDTKLNVVIDAGKAYVNGFEFETVSKTVLELDKARDTEFYNNSDAYIRYGQYYVVSSVTGGLFNPNGLEFVNLFNASAVNIGSARVKAVYPDTDNKLRIYLTDVQCSDSNAVRTIVGSSAVAQVDISGGTIDLLKGTQSILIAPFFPENPKVGTLGDVNYRTQRFFAGNLDVNTQITISTASPNERFVGSGTYVGSDSFIKTNYTFLVDGAIATPTSVAIPSVGSTEVGRMIVTFASGNVVNILSSIEINSSTPKVKVRKTATKTVSVGTSWVDLDFADVIVNSVAVTDGATDVTGEFEFDDGQRDEFYSLGRVRKLSGAPTSVTVTYDYYEHSGNGYFNVDSYVGEDYGNIPSYTSGSDVYELRSCFDFRPLLVGGTLAAQIPTNNSSVSFDYEYFVPRYDLVVVTKAKELAIVRGTPELTPKVPQEPMGSMTLYVLRVSAYTLNERDLGVRFVENRRYTMRDIGKLEKRIENLEYYTALSLLETKTSTLTVEGRFRNGFLVDSFNNYDIADTNQFGFECYIDSTERTCSPGFIPTDYDLNLTAVPSDVLRTEDNVLIKNYTEKSFVEQKVITGFINVNPFNVFTWVGRAKLSPEVDNWIEENRLPDVVNTIVTDNVPPGWKPTATIVASTTLQRIWLNSYPHSAARDWAARNQLMEAFARRFGLPSVGVVSFSSYGYVGIGSVQQQTIQTSTVRETTTKISDNDAVLAQSAIPYIRQKDVTVTVEGLLPNKRYYFRFDEIDVNENVMALANGSIPAGAFGGEVKTNDRGVLKALFRIPGGKFKTGARIFRISDNITHNRDAETSFAVATYTAEGFLVTKQRTVTLNKIREVDTERTTRNVVSFEWYDPLAQTFLVDSNQYPEGLFVSSVDLYFTAKDTKIPVSVALRPTVNGYPSSTETYPFATKTLQPESVVVNDLANANLKGYADSNFIPTKFKFDTPVYLSPGEHSLVVMANTNNYVVGYATIGKNIYNSSSVMTENPYNGVMFISQNASTWTADQYSDLCFKLNRAEFIPGQSNPIVWNVDYQEDAQYDTVNFSSGLTDFDSTDYAFQMTTKRLGGTVETKNVDVNSINIMDGARVIESANDVVITGALTATNLLSPVLDLEHTHLVTTQNIITNSATDEEQPYHGESLARYIHKQVSLTDDFIATDLRVWMDAYVPSSADIKVYLRAQNTTNDSTPFYDLGWTELSLVNSSGVEREYRITVPAGFNAYQTKVVMISSDSTKVPSFSNFRVVTFQE